MEKGMETHAEGIEKGMESLGQSLSIGYCVTGVISTFIVTYKK
jgi:hypothetical protein